MLSSREKIRFDDHLGLVSAFQRGAAAVLDDIGAATSAKFGTEGVERVGDHGVLHFAGEQLLVERGGGIAEAGLPGYSSMNLIW